VIYEPKNRVDVTTPRGDGVIWLVTDYGHETDTIYTVILKGTSMSDSEHKVEADSTDQAIDFVLEKISFDVQQVWCEDIHEVL